MSVPGRIGGAKARVRILARDVSLSLREATDSSVLNRLHGHVENVTLEGDHAYVALRCGQARVLSQISRFSLDQLQIRTGQGVVAQIKGVAVRQAYADS